MDYDVRDYWLAIARGDGSAVGICRDPLVVRLALARARDELDRAAADYCPGIDAPARSLKHPTGAES